jgi:hypothetical protein
MTAQMLIEEIKALPVTERAKVFAYVEHAQAQPPPDLEYLLSVGLAQLDRGERLPGEQVMAELESLGRQRRSANG